SRQFVLFVAALFVFGGGYGANRLARYVTADLYPPAVRATMIGWIVWASTIGAVAGPALLAPSRGLAERIALNGLVGPYLVCAAACALAVAMMLAAPRDIFAAAHDHAPASRPAAAGGIRVALAHPLVGLALTSMVSGQFVMVLVMTMTPVHVRHGGHGLGAIGLVIAAHTLGMYALSPVTGRLGDRYGRLPLLAAAVGTIATACVVGAAAQASYPLTLVALFLLGIGWNLGFVGGSALLTDSIAPAERVRVQGFGDALIWGGGALASTMSGWMLEHAGFRWLCLAGLALSLAPLVPLRRLRLDAVRRVHVPE
ncbi:MAG: MFS transporter, partial [Vicinamibacterales bacterium]